MIRRFKAGNPSIEYVSEMVIYPYGFQFFSKISKLSL